MNNMEKVEDTATDKAMGNAGCNVSPVNHVGKRNAVCVSETPGEFRDSGIDSLPSSSRSSRTSSTGVSLETDLVQAGRRINEAFPMHNDAGHQVTQKLEGSCSSGQPFPEEEAIEHMNGAEFKEKFEAAMKSKIGATVTLLKVHQGCIELVLKVPDQESKTKLEDAIKSGEMTNLISKLLAEKFGSVSLKATEPVKVVILATDSDCPLSEDKDHQQLLNGSSIPTTIPDSVKAPFSFIASINAQENDEGYSSYPGSHRSSANDYNP